MNEEILQTTDGLFCIECKSLCHTYEQGLCCNCGQPWETEVMDNKEYPSKWIECEIIVKRKPQ